MSITLEDMQRADWEGALESKFEAGIKIGKRSGRKEGKEEGIKATLIATNIYLLSKRFGFLPNNMAREIEKQLILKL